MDTSITEKPILNDGETRGLQYLKDQVDYTIASCNVTGKDTVDQAYKIRNGEMPMEEYAYLKDANGIELPSQVRHIPVLKSMFDVLLGDEALQPIPWRIKCNDNGSIETMMKERHQNFISGLDKIILDSIKNLVSEVNYTKKDLSPITSLASKTDFAKRQQDYSQYKTYLEIYSQKVMQGEYDALNMRHSFSVMYNDMITTGEEYYQSKVEAKGRPPRFRSINPKYLFYTKTEDIFFIKDCDRVVYVEEIPASVVFAKHGHKFSKEEREIFFHNYAKGISQDDTRLIASKDGIVEGSFGNFSAKNLKSDLVKIYNVEWKENTKIESVAEDEIVISGKKKKVKETMTRYRLDRYEGLRIGEKIFVDIGKSTCVTRTSREPWNVSLTFNGSCYNDRNGKPFSLVLATKQLAMKIDVLHYFLENMIAVSGTKVIPVSFPDIPTWLDENDPINRVKKWMGHLKNGAMLLDYSQDGAGKFQNYSAYDLTISNSIKTIADIIVMLEETAAKITGVGRHRLGQMLQKDGKGVTENAIEQSSVVTQPIIQVHNVVMKMALTDHLNNCRIAFPDGYPGLFSLGNYGREIFSKGHQQFVLADLDVTVSDSSQTIKAIEEIKLLSKELAIATGVNTSFLFDIIGNESLSHVKELAKSAFESGKEDKIEELTTKLQEANGQLQQYYAELQRLQQSGAELKAQELQFKDKELEEKTALEKTKQKIDRDFNLRKLENDNKRIQLEHLQLAYVPGSKEIRNN